VILLACAGAVYDSTQKYKYSVCYFGGSNCPRLSMNLTERKRLTPYIQQCVAEVMLYGKSLDAHVCFTRMRVSTAHTYMAAVEAHSHHTPAYIHTRYMQGERNPMLYGDCVCQMRVCLSVCVRVYQKDR
jgi:hypothetical protein